MKNGSGSFGPYDRDHMDLGQVSVKLISVNKSVRGKKMKIFLLIMAALILSPVCSVQTTAQQRSQYAGQEKRKIKSLSASDIEQLSQGRGWGLARVAELNGYPGPVHLIEMKDKIGLTKEQLLAVEKLYAEMKARAVPLGLKLIELEKQLDDSFAGGSINEEKLKDLLELIAAVRRDLRLVHVSTHLKTPAILTREQIEKYNRLRGYDTKDPCRNIPAGHDPEMWKKHNGCQ
jgi:Spy/CpxP family protein refolding chaperone